MKFSTAFVALSLSAAVSAGPAFVRRAAFTEQNGKDAIALNNKFKALNANSACQAGENACVDNKFAQCVGGKFVLQPCASTLICAALPLVNSPGTSITCTTEADRDARIAATGATAAGSAAGGKAAPAASATAAQNNAAAGNAAATTTAAAAAATSAAAGDNSDPQKSLTLVQSVIATGFENDGQDQPTAGQVKSLTSSNNFINFCATVPDKPITNGKQIQTGSCNPAPMGVIASTANMPSGKFVNPKNGATLPANKDFTIQFAVKHLETGHFTNAQQNYFAAPQVVNAAGDVQGHSHFVIEQLTSLDQTTPTDPSKFAFFKGANDPAKDGIMSVAVAGGLPAGVYRIASINAAANHQPILVAIAQHGSLDDMAYFTVA